MEQLLRPGRVSLYTGFAWSPPPSTSVEPPRRSAENGHLSCPLGWRRVKAVPPPAAGGSPRGRWAANYPGERADGLMLAEPEADAFRHADIRRARQEDAEAVAEITDSAYGSFIPLLGRKPQPMTADHRKMIGENDVWLLFSEDYPVGVLVLVDEPDSLLIYSVAIRPELQKRGLGRRLLGWAELEARRVGRPRIRLYTNALMAGNIELYRALGYLETDREPYMGSTLVHMSKWLDGDVGRDP